jgi:hypothetical protein
MDDAEPKFTGADLQRVINEFLPELYDAVNDDINAYFSVLSMMIALTVYDIAITDKVPLKHIKAAMNAKLKGAYRLVGQSRKTPREQSEPIMATENERR